MTHTLRSLALPTALAGTLVLASCGTSSNVGHDVSGMNGRTTGAPIASGTQTTGPKNAADVAFATMMIPPQVQSRVMADMAVKQGTDTKIRALAAKIKTAQGPQIARMSGWLTGWGAPVPGGSPGQGMSGMSGMGGQTGGMASGQEMTDLGRASGSTFDRMWLQMMIRQHRGAVAMARTELAQGTNPHGKALARSILDSQSTQIAQMTSILTRIPG
jgi:uncharacterized protein (DUF305 family)